MLYKSFIVVFLAMGICGQPMDDQSSSVGRNNTTIAVNPHRNPVNFVINTACCPCNKRSSTVRGRDDYQHTPGIGYHKLHTRSLNWTSAKKSCEDEGGHLAIINSPSEAEVLRKLFGNAGEITGAYINSWAWLGIHDIHEEGTWMTIFGDSLPSAGYNVWANGEPNNSGRGEDCGVFWFNKNLNDAHCENAYAYFCEL